MPSLSVEEFLALLEKSNVLSDEQFEALVRDFPSVAAATRRGGSSPARPATSSGDENPRAVESIIERLIEREWLTAWQATMLKARRPNLYLGRYRLLECIGTGGMGAVYKARHERMGRLVALKIMAQSLAGNPRAMARFRQEIQAVSALNHPNIVAAYDADFVGNVHFLVMEYVDGHDLGWHVGQGVPLPISWVCECIRQAALGLEHAHGQGLVHRDIKPTNLLATRHAEDGRLLVKILDLGLARLATETEPEERLRPGRTPVAGELTQAGQVLGTPDYMSPEQGVDTRFADARSDLFSLGCTMFRLLTGEMAFPGDTPAEKLAARQTGPPRVLRDLRPEIPAPLALVVTRMLARDPAERFRSAKEVAAALEPFAKTETARPPPPLPAPRSRPSRPAVRPEADARFDELLAHLASHAADDTPPRAVSKSPRLRLSRRAAWILAASAVGLLLVGALYRLGQVTLTVEWPLDQRQHGSLSVDGRVIAIPAGPMVRITGRSGPWRLELTRAGYEPIHENLEMSFGESRRYSAAWRPTPQSVRREELDALVRRSAALKSADAVELDVQRAREELIRFRCRQAGFPEASAATGWLATLRSPLDRLSRSGLTDAALRQAGQGDAKRALPEIVGVLGDGPLQFWNRVTSVSVSHDGVWIAAAGRDGTVRIFDRLAGAQRHQIALSVDPVEVLFSPADDTLAVAGNRPDVTLWKAGPGTQRTILIGASRPLAFSGDGQSFAAFGRGGSILVSTIATGKIRRIPSGHSGALRRLALNADGSRLASYGNDATVIVRDLEADRELGKFVRSHWPRFGPDGTLLAIGGGDGHLRLYDAGGTLQKTLSGGGDPLGFSADGRSLVSYRMGRAHVWDPQTGQSLRTIGDVPALAALSPDATTLVAAATNPFELRFWNVKTGTKQATVGVASAVSALTFAPDSAQVVTVGAERAFRQWNPLSGREETAASATWNDVACDPDGRFVAIAGREAATLWDLIASDRPLQMLEGESAQLGRLAWSPDGRWLAGIGEPPVARASLHVWNAADGSELFPVAEQRATFGALEFDPRGERLATAGSDRRVSLWEVPRRTIPKAFADAPEQTSALAFDGEGRWLAAAGRSGPVSLWDLRSNDVRSLEAEAASGVRRLTFAPHGRRLVGCTDGGLPIWDVASGKLLHTLSCKPATPTCLSFSPSGNRLAVAGDSGMIWIWKWPRDGLPDAEPDRKLQIGPAGGLIRQLFWSLDDRHLLSVNGNSTLYVLRLPDKDE